jgi:hypothetical protein
MKIHKITSKLPARFVCFSKNKERSRLACSSVLFTYEPDSSEFFRSILLCSMSRGVDINCCADMFVFVSMCSPLATLVSILKLKKKRSSILGFLPSSAFKRSKCACRTPLLRSASLCCACISIGFSCSENL